MVVVFGKTVDEIRIVVNLDLIWAFRVEGNRVMFLKDDGTWAKPNLEGIGTAQEVMKYISYALTNELKVCFVTEETINAFKDRLSGERDNLIRKERILRNAMARTKAALSKEENKDADNIL